MTSRCRGLQLQFCVNRQLHAELSALSCTSVSNVSLGFACSAGVTCHQCHGVLHHSKAALGDLRQDLKLCREKAACSRWSTSLPHAKLPCQSALGALLFKVIDRHSCSRCPCNSCCLFSSFSMSASTCQRTQCFFWQHSKTGGHLPGKPHWVNDNSRLRLITCDSSASTASSWSSGLY